MKGYENRVTCSSGSPAPPGKVCDVPLDTFGPCTPKNGYSYNQSSPCIFIKLNRVCCIFLKNQFAVTIYQFQIFNWVPEYYNDSTALPAELDPDLPAYIAGQAEVGLLLSFFFI